MYIFPTHTIPWIVIINSHDTHGAEQPLCILQNWCLLLSIHVRKVREMNLKLFHILNLKPQRYLLSGKTINCSKSWLFIFELGLLWYCFFKLPSLCILCLVRMGDEKHYRITQSHNIGAICTSIELVCMVYSVNLVYYLSTFYIK